MSLDIRVKKKLPSSNTVPAQPVVKPVVKLPVENNQDNKQPPQPPVKEKKKSKNNIWWWLLFLVLFILFVGIIYFIWRDNQTLSGLNTTKPSPTPPGIVSNFPTEIVTPQQNTTNDDQTTFNLDLLTARVAEFEQTVNNLFFTATATSGTSTIANNIEIDKNSFELANSAKALFDFLSKQYESLLILAQANSNYDQNIDYLTAIEDYLTRIDGEIKVLDALLALEENQSFSNEITVSFKNLNNYFKEIRSFVKLVDQILVNEFNDSSNELVDITATTTTTSTISTSTVGEIAN